MYKNGWFNVDLSILLFYFCIGCVSISWNTNLQAEGFDM